MVTADESSWWEEGEEEEEEEEEAQRCNLLCVCPVEVVLASGALRKDVEESMAALALALASLPWTGRWYSAMVCILCAERSNARMYV